MKEEWGFWKILTFILIGLFVFLIMILSSILTSKINLEGECSVDGLSLKFNETNYPKNITLSDSEIKCHFKGEGPLLLLLGR